jgi:hypothetical protein
MARVLLILASIAAAFSVAGQAQAAGGNYIFEGASARQQGQVKAALNASTFNWNLVPALITIHVAPGTGTYAQPGHIYLDADLLTADRFAWASIQDEYAHQVDFFLFNAEQRQRLNLALGGGDWCYGVAGLGHAQYGCERFASMLVWSFWQSKDNSYRPASLKDESAAMAPAKFRKFLAQILQERIQA